MDATVNKVVEKFISDNCDKDLLDNALSSLDFCDKLCHNIESDLNLYYNCIAILFGRFGMNLYQLANKMNEAQLDNIVLVKFYNLPF